jgi:hypothetical protein
MLIFPSFSVHYSIISKLKHKQLRANKLCVDNKRSKSLIFYSLLIQYRDSSLKCFRINIDKHLVASSCPSVRLYQMEQHWKHICEIWQPTGEAWKNLPQNSKYGWNRTTVLRTSHECLSTFIMLTEHGIFCGWTTGQRKHTVAFSWQQWLCECVTSRHT